LVVERNELVLRLSWWERIVAVHGNVRVPLSSVSWVKVEANPAERMRRLFQQTSYGPLSMQVPYGRRLDYFLAVPRRRPAVLVGLEPPARFLGLLVSVPDPEATAARIMNAKNAPRG
jgi:hypothetical protein